MKFSDIRDQAQNDIGFDPTELDKESLRTPIIHNKYLNIYHDERIVLKKLKRDLAVLIRAKWEYYSGKMSPEEMKERGWQPFQLKLLKQDLDRYIESDDDVMIMQDRITYQEEKVLYVESVLKSINSRNWEIRNAIEWQKFTNGGT